MVEPRHVHLVATKHVMRYLKGMICYGLSYTKDHDFGLYGYTDSYWAGTVSDRKSTSGGCFNLGLSMISWISRNHSNVTFSNVEVEYIAACSASCESIWIQNLLSDLFDM